jgi:hypothetical protein
MKLEHALLLKEYHLKCDYKYTYPVAWSDRLNQINKLIKELKKAI